MRPNGGRLRTVEHCTGGWSTLHSVVIVALLVLLVITPILTATFLARRARAPRSGF